MSNKHETGYEFSKCQIVDRSANAYLVDTHIGEIWIPKSQVFIGTEEDYAIPMWLTWEKGLD